MRTHFNGHLDSAWLYLGDKNYLCCKLWTHIMNEKEGQEREERKCQKMSSPLARMFSSETLSWYGGAMYFKQ